MALYSTGQGAGGDPTEFSKQLIWFLVGFVVLIFLTFFDYKNFKKICFPLYFIFIILLFAVLFVNRNNGATSWFKVGRMSFQPAEFFKIAIVITNAFLIEHFKEKENLSKIHNIIILLLIVAIPTVLIIKQPDYGTAAVVILTTAIMLFVGGIDFKYIVAIAVVAIILIPIAYNFIPQHAKDRINVYLNPESDPKGAGYNIIQSKLAVGSGQAFGMGFLNGNQTQLGTLPMKSTDFIFPVIGEEMGFFVSSLVIILYLILLVRLLYIARHAKDTFGELICIGTFAIILLHFVENIGMSMGLLPITGIPLPFISYGGSSMLTNMILIGICESVSAHRKKHLL